MLANIRVKDYMSTNLVSFNPQTDVYQAIRKLLEMKITGAPVLDDKGHLVGLFSELECLKVALSTGYYEDMGGKVGEFMSTDLDTVDEDASVLKVAEMFSQSTQRQFPVLWDGALVGLISRVDVLKALLAIRD